MYQIMLEALKTEMSIAIMESEKFEKGNATAGTRLRKSLQNIKSICSDLRKEVTEKKKK